MHVHSYGKLSLSFGYSLFQSLACESSSYLQEMNRFYYTWDNNYYTAKF